MFSCILSHTFYELRYQVTSLPCFHVFFRIHFLSCGIKLRLNRKKTVFSIFLPHTLFKIRLTSYGTTVTNNRISVFAYNSLIYFTGDRFDGKLNKCQITTLHPSWSGQVDSLEHSTVALNLISFEVPIPKDLLSTGYLHRLQHQSFVCDLSFGSLPVSLPEATL